MLSLRWRRLNLTPLHHNLKELKHKPNAEQQQLNAAKKNSTLIYFVGHSSPTEGTAQLMESHFKGGSSPTGGVLRWQMVMSR